MLQPAKKICNSSGSLIAELKELAPRLKKKPSEFDPSTVVCWEKGKPVPFLFLCLAFDMIDKESGRIVITDIACNLLRTVIHATPEDLVPVVYFLANRIAPAHEGLELGIGDASIIKALAESCGRTESQIRKLNKVFGIFVCLIDCCIFSHKLFSRVEIDSCLCRIEVIWDWSPKSAVHLSQ